MLIDTHCHLDFPSLSQQLDQLLAEAQAEGICGWVVPGVCPNHWFRVMALCRRVPGSFPAYGIHPQYAASATEEDLTLLNQLAPQGIAIGEIGLDRFGPDLLRQESLFRQQLRIAVRYGLPVLIHCRGMIGRTLQIMREERTDQVGGIMHAFSGSLESAQGCIRLGLAISISGTITWQNARRSLRLARELPLERLVLESDAPDLIPQPHRGAAGNRPAWLRLTAEKLAAVRGITIESVAMQTTATAQRILRINPY